MRDLLRDRLALAALVLALVLRIGYFAEVRSHDLDLSANPMLDMVYLHQNASRIASGDLLLRDQFLGFYARMREEMYGPAKYDELFEPHAYHDSPGYLYFAAACESVVRSPYAVVFAQELLDTLACALVYVLARRASGRAAARLALVAAALSPEAVAHAGFVLRESFLAFLGTLLVLALDEARRSGRPRAWAGAGLVLGLAWLSKLTFSLVAPFAALMALLPRESDASERGPARARRLAALVLGASLPLVPLAARNVALDVSPLRTSVVGPALMVQRNMPGYSGAAEHQDHERVRAILARSGDSTLGAWLATVESYPRPLDYVLLEGRKLEFFWLGVDFWNDIAVSWLRPLSPWLSPCVFRWGVLGPWVLLGVVHALVSRERRRALLPHLAFFLALGVATALLSGAYTRYRLVVQPVACVFFATTVVETAAGLRAGKQRALVAGCTLAMALALHWLLADPRTEEQQGLTRRNLHGWIEGTWAASPAARAYLHARVEASALPR